MNEFFTWNALATYAGATMATALIPQLFKGVGALKRVPTRLFSFGVAYVVLTLAHIFTGGFTWSCLALCAINAVVVSLASNGAFEAVHAKGERGRSR